MPFYFLGNISLGMQVTNMGIGAIVISLPFSCVLGLLSSMASSTMGRFAKETSDIILDH